MNDFLKTMSQLGVESILPETELTLEQEMAEEIAMEAELDEAYDHMELANIVASTSQAEAMLTAMAEREIGLESNVGRNAEDIYKEFGLEAIKDVVARKAYSAVSSLKALINTCISWLKQLMGISVASKKIFSGIAKKAKAMDKNLRKVVSKVNEKLKRDMPDYKAALDKYFTTKTSGKTVWDKLVSVSKGAQGKSQDRDEWIGDSMLKSNKSALKTRITTTETAIETIKKAKEELRDNGYDKSDTNEYEGTACYNHILNNIKNIETLANANKSTDVGKEFDKNIKALEKVRSDMNKKDVTVTAPTELGKFLNKQIQYYNEYAQYAKSILKTFTAISDDCLTMGKSIYAALV